MRDVESNWISWKRIINRARQDETRKKKEEGEKETCRAKESKRKVKLESVEWNVIGRTWSAEEMKEEEKKKQAQRSDGEGLETYSLNYLKRKLAR